MKIIYIHKLKNDNKDIYTYYSVILEENYNRGKRDEIRKLSKKVQYRNLYSK